MAYRKTRRSRRSSFGARNRRSGRSYAPRKSRRGGMRGRSGGGNTLRIVLESPSPAVTTPAMLAERFAPAPSRPGRSSRF